MSKSLDPDQARRFVSHYLGPNCLHKLSADDTCRQSSNVNENKVNVCFKSSIGGVLCEFVGRWGWWSDWVHRCSQLEPYLRSCRTATLDFFSIWLNLKSQCFCALS